MTRKKLIVLGVGVALVGGALTLTTLAWLDLRDTQTARDDARQAAEQIAMERRSLEDAIDEATARAARAAALEGSDAGPRWRLSEEISPLPLLMAIEEAAGQAGVHLEDVRLPRSRAEDAQALDVDAVGDATALARFLAHLEQRRDVLVLTQLELRPRPDRTLALSATALAHRAEPAAPPPAAPGTPGAGEEEVSHEG